MARSEIVTWLSLDEWGSIMGVNPLFMNQLNSTKYFPNNVCGGPWFQNAYQHSDRIGRDDLAIAIKEAEEEISREVGYNLMPDWTAQERLPYPRPGIPGAFNVWGTGPRGLFKSVETPRGHLISGGVKTKVLIQAGVTFTRTDKDSDTYQETCTAIVPVSFTDINQVHVYYPATNGEDAWEVRPITVSISGGFATITWKAWLISAANEQNNLNPQPLDADSPNSYETTVDVYQVYNDPSVQVKFLWENGGVPGLLGFPGLSLCGGCGTCQACQFGTQNGCMHFRDPRIGITVPAPGDWDPTTQTFSSSWWAMYREPDQVELWYYSGFVDQNMKRPYAELSNYWKTAVAYFAAAKLDRPVYGCSNVVEFVQKWQRDLMFRDDKSAFTVTPSVADNRLGTTAGAVYAWKRIHQNGVRVTK